MLGNCPRPQQEFQGTCTPQFYDLIVQFLRQEQCSFVNTSIDSLQSLLVYTQLDANCPRNNNVGYSPKCSQALSPDEPLPCHADSWGHEQPPQQRRQSAAQNPHSDILRQCEAIDRLNCSLVNRPQMDWSWRIRTPSWKQKVCSTQPLGGLHSNASAYGARPLPWETAFSLRHPAHQELSLRQLFQVGGKDLAETPLANSLFDLHSTDVENWNAFNRGSNAIF